MIELFTMENAIALVTLSALEIVLGIDNIIVIAILAGKLEPSQRDKARLVGLGLAMGIRILLLLSITWIMSLTTPLFRAIGHDVTGRDLVLIIGGFFLIAKSTHEIHSKLEPPKEHHDGTAPKHANFVSVIIQILILDIVFSLDSVITAVGMAQSIAIMIAAVIIAVIVMMFFSGYISRFVDRHPTIKMLALAFLILIGVMLVADGFGQHVSKGYIYTAMAFSLFVEMLNMRIRKIHS
jgi:predicted tellurium resistance membrane protein TerC